MGVRVETGTIRTFYIRAGAFIPFDFVPRPGELPVPHPSATCSSLAPPPPGVLAGVDPRIVETLVYRGDVRRGKGYGRSPGHLFDPDSDAFRFRATVKVDEEGNILDDQVFVNASKSYAPDALTDGIVDDGDDDDKFNDCHLLHQAAVDKPTVAITAVRTGNKRVPVTVAAAGAIPLLPLAPAIDFVYRIEIDASAAAAIYQVTGRHDAFPSHEVYINNDTVVAYDAAASGATAVMLTTLPDGPAIPVKVECTEGACMVQP